MQFHEYHEDKQRGTLDFPFEFYHVTPEYSRYIMNYHWHIEFEFIRILQGEFYANLEGKEVIAKEGDFLFINGGTLHSGIPQKNCIYECLVFDMNAFLKHNPSCQKMVQAISDHTILVYHHFKATDIETHDIIWNIFDAMKDRPEGYELTVFGEIYHFLGTVYRRHLYFHETEAPQTRRDYKRIRQLKSVLELVENNYSNPITLDDMANIVHMSPKYFCKFFAEMTRQRPMDYLNRHRVERACFELASTDLSVTEIAYNCGFNDLSYFIKTFRKYKGVTPGQYKKS